MSDGDWLGLLFTISAVAIAIGVLIGVWTFKFQLMHEIRRNGMITLTVQYRLVGHLEKATIVYEKDETVT